MNLPEYIEIIKGGDNPLSCHCFVIKGKENTWVYDAGANDETFEKINSLENVCLVLSHFHQDHITNVARLNPKEIYQGELTLEHTHKGSATKEEITISDGFDFRIFPLPNTHAKGSLGLEVGEYAFLGDAIFPAHIKGHHAYNATLLKEEIETLKNCNAKYFVLSHNDEYIYSKEDMLSRLERVYSKRIPQQAYINLD